MIAARHLQCADRVLAFVDGPVALLKRVSRWRLRKKEVAKAAGQNRPKIKVCVLKRVWLFCVSKDGPSK